jgi:subtilisin family serine protease
MLPQLFLWLILATGATPPPAQASIEAPRAVAQTILADSSGITRVENHTLEPGDATTRYVQSGGKAGETTWHANARVLIEIQARPVRDRRNPGSVTETSRQREQLSTDLKALDVRLHPRTPSRITRELHVLFSGVAATVDSSVIGEIRRLPNVAAVYEDAQVHASLNESVPLIGAPTVWSTYGVNGAGVKVAVIDTGIDYTHPDLGGCLGVACKVAGGYDFVNGDNDPRDDHGHGTHVAGIIAANGVLKGVAPGVTLLAYKVLNESGSGFASDIIAAIERALADGAKVANLSLGGPGDSGDPTSQAIDNATAAGMLSVVAAGNSGPSYLTISSPGTARTALTVGAADKSWVMASFSSRGYVTDGNDFVMKPEVVAPGVSILSTVPSTGMLGNPTRYAALSGTSMATPHVAGSAALLLEWNASLSPQDIKNRLAGSARSIGQDPFTQGAGAIDLVAAFGLPILASATNVSFGVIDATSGIVTRDQTISVRNTAGSNRTLSFTADSTLPSGTTLEIIPSSMTLQDGESANVTLRLQVNAAVTPEAPDPLAWSTRIAISNGAQTAHLPAFFFKGSVLTLSFDEPPWYVDLVSESGAVRVFWNPASSLSALVKSGTWDVVTGYLPPLAIVVREQQNVQGSIALSIGRGEAIHAVSARPVDDAGQPLRESDHLRTLVLGMPASATPGLPNAIGSTLAFSDFRVSDLSSRYLLALTGGGPDPSGLNFFGSGWIGKGLSSDVTLPIGGVPYRRLAEAATQPPGTTSALLFVYLGWAMKTSWGATADLGASARPGELSRTVHLQWNVSPGLAVLPIHKSILMGFDSVNLTDWVDGAYLNYGDMANIGVDSSPFFDLLDSSRRPETVLGTNIERWNLDTPPTALPIELHNDSSTISGGYNSDVASWMTHTISRLSRVSNVPPAFDLYRGGALTGTYPLYTLQSGIPSAAGAQEIRSASAYAIGGVAGSSQVVLSFDTSKTDRDPPVLSRFRIEQNGIRTATPFLPSKKSITVKFRATDAFNLTSVVLEWRQSGTTSWSPLPLGGTQPDYEAPLQHGGSIDLRVTAADSSGNTFQEQWTPALITTTAAPPIAPSSVTATRSGTTAISISWAPSTSDAGIAGYRIERLPGNQTFTTSGTGTTFLDTSGLVAGSAYFYRVFAVDLENAVSTPSSYDVVTLIEFADDPAGPGLTPIRGAHVGDLRLAIDAVRQAAGLERAWTNYGPPAGVVQASHFVELRDRLNEARAARSIPAVQLSDPVAAGTTVRARTVQQLRDGVK